MLIATSGWTRSSSIGGYDFAIDPSLNVPDAPVFWLPHVDTSVVVLAPSPAVLSARTDSDISSLTALKTIRADENSLHALWPLPLDQRLQLFCGGTRSLAAVIPLNLDGFNRLESIYRLLASLHGRIVPPDRRLTRQQKARSQRMLQAFDGLRAGATQQEIAQVIFRTPRFDREEWQVSSVRHSVMSLIRDARNMIAGGYRKLLRHRRKS